MSPTGPGAPAQSATANREVVSGTSFSALVWRPGQLDAGLNLLATHDNVVGHLSGFAPLGSIHRVHNIADTTAISMHIDGTDVSRARSSAGRSYD